MRNFVLLALLLLSNVIVGQKKIDQQKLDSFFKLLEDHDKFMGGVAIYSGEDLLYETYCGYADVENHLKADSLTLYRIGSITKMFTSVLVFNQIEQGRLTLGTKLSKFYPDIKNAYLITIEHLLQHRSGIHNFTDDADYLGYMTMEKSRSDLLEIIQSKPSDFVPGDQMKYSNSNFVLLSLILEDVSGKSYMELVDGLCKQYGLNNTRFGGPIDVAQNEAYSYYYQDKWVKSNETNTSIPLGAGSIVSTPRDLNRFIQKLFNGELIPDSLFRQMIELKDEVGLGIFRFPFYEKTLLGHNGGIDGFRSNLAIYPDDKISIAVTGNGFSYDLNNILIACLSAAFDREYELPDFSAKSINIPIEELTQLEGSYVSAQMPLKIKLFLKDDMLLAQATGQGAFPLTPFEGGVFKFEQAGIEMIFTLENDKLVPGQFQLKQRGAVFFFTKE